MHKERAVERDILLLTIFFLQSLRYHNRIYRDTEVLSVDQVRVQALGLAVDQYPLEVNQIQVLPVVLHHIH